MRNKIKQYTRQEGGVVPSATRQVPLKTRRINISRVIRSHYALPTASNTGAERETERKREDRLKKGGREEETKEKSE